MMHPVSIQAMGDELTKISGLGDRDYVRNRARDAGSSAKANWGKFKKWFNGRSPVGQAATIGGIAGGVRGAFKGFTDDSPTFDYDTGEVKRPSVGRRVLRGAGKGLTGAAEGAAMSAGTTYLVRKLTHG
jgi:hypothetical protein